MVCKYSFNCKGAVFRLFTLFFVVVVLQFVKHAAVASWTTDRVLVYSQRCVVQVRDRA